MTIITRAEIERKLLSGLPIKVGSKTIELATPLQRRLFKYLLTSSIRNPSELPPEFINDLAALHADTTDPQAEVAQSNSAPYTNDVWYLKTIYTLGFGGINTFGGSPFRLDLEGNSLLAEGPNGCGKSSLASAIIWAFSGERPRDHVTNKTQNAIFDNDGAKLCEWPSIAAMPQKISDLKSQPFVRVELTFINQRGDEEKVIRQLQGTVEAAKVPVDIRLSETLFDTGLVMPSILASLKFEKGQTRLSDAVKKVTRLDDLAAMGNLCAGLSHGAREYRALHTKDIAAASQRFEANLKNARDALKPLGLSIPDYLPTDVIDADGEFIPFAKSLKESSVALTAALNEDLAKGKDFNASQTQTNAVITLANVQEFLANGLENSRSWKFLESLVSELKNSHYIEVAIEEAICQAEEAKSYLEQANRDSKFRLKAQAAKWHQTHKSGAVEECPLCEAVLDEANPLRQELENMRLAGDEVARSFDDNIGRILRDFEKEMPPSVSSMRIDLQTFNAAQVYSDIDVAFQNIRGVKESFPNLPSKFKSFMAQAPNNESHIDAPPGPEYDVLAPVYARICEAKYLLQLIKNHNEDREKIRVWWSSAASSVKGDEGANTSIGNYIQTLKQALIEAQPYATGVSFLQMVWKDGSELVKMKAAQKVREEVAAAAMDLKNLVPVVDELAKSAIDELSDKMSVILEKILIVDPLRFKGARLDPKEGIGFKAALNDNFQIEAAGIANTSWVRAALWAFIFALRASEVETLGNDTLPILLFDDPQATFDLNHRTRWAQYVASEQHGPSKAQVILLSHDSTFLQQIKINDVQGRDAIIALPNADTDFLGIIEGDTPKRLWATATKENTEKGGVDYLNDMRVHVETLLRIMLRGYDPDINSVQRGLVIGKAREKLNQYHLAGIAPWNTKPVSTLARILDGTNAQISNLEQAHHGGRALLGMAEAADVEAYWSGHLQPALHSVFRHLREYSIYHSGLSFLHGPKTSKSLPDGHKDDVKTLQLELRGRVAALTNGRAADGKFTFDASVSPKRVVLAKHLAYRLIADTLEPVAQTGDILLVKEKTHPSPNSLAVALDDSQSYARRYELAANQSDIAILTAQALNPARIKQPYLCQASTITAFKVVGVLYDRFGKPPIVGVDEISECDSGSIKTFSSRASGLWEVVGSSAEPFALNGQYIIAGDGVLPIDAINHMRGQPVIAEDSNGDLYFKRLQVPDDKNIILESLDSGGTHDPIVLRRPAVGALTLARVWPVYGILFELP